MYTRGGQAVLRIGCQRGCAGPSAASPPGFGSGAPVPSATYLSHNVT